MSAVTPPNAELDALAARLPMVLAVPLSEYLQDDHSVLVLWHLCDLVELSLRFLVIAGLSEHREQLPDELAQILKQHIERPSLGNWCAMARAVGRAVPPTSMLPELPATVALLDAILGKPAESPERGLLALRNRLAHGGGLRREAAERLLSIWRPRAVEMVRALSWLADTRLVAFGADGNAVLLRGESAQPIDAADVSMPAPAEAGRAMWLVRGDRSLGLWPLGTYDGTPGFEQPQVYMRREEVRLMYAVLGGEVALGQSTPDAVALFLRLFRLDAEFALPRGFAVRGFDDVMRQEAARRVGREAELTMLRDAVRSSRHRLVWVTGPAGIGKSNMMACVAVELLQDPPTQTLVLPYRFRASDERCSRDMFIRFAIERLTAWSGLTSAATSESASRKAHLGPLDQLRSLLERIRDDHTVLFILDGLDEIAERDRRFAADVVLVLARDGARMTCAGRPEHDLAGTFAQAGAYEPFAGGLPSMSSLDVREMLVSATDRLRNRLVKRDRESIDGVRNPFIERVVVLSEGLPLYIGYVIQDLASGRVSPEHEGHLPAGLHAYHAELLHRCVVGDLHAVMTPLVALLALAREPLAPLTIAAILVRRGVLATTNVALVERALAAVASMVRRTPDSDEGFVLYHHSLRTHILASDQMSETVAVTRHALANAALQPAGDAAEMYLYRSGVAHLVDDDRHAEALALLTNFDGVMTRFERLGSDQSVAVGWYADWDRVRSSLRLERDAVAWWDFARASRHLFHKAGWRAERVLFQAAMDHADDSPVTVAAERFAESGRCNWLWLRQVNRPAEYQPNPMITVLAGHRDSIRGASMLADGRILSWSNAAMARDGSLRLWNGETGASLAVLEGHKYGANGAFAVTDNRILSWSSADPAVRLWDDTTGMQLAPLAGHTANVRGAIALSAHEVLSWCSRSLRRWDHQSGDCLAVMTGHTSDVNGVTVLSDGRFLSWSTGVPRKGDEGESPTLKTWAGPSGEFERDFVGHEGPIAGAMELSEGRILSWSHDKTLRLWDAATGEQRRVFFGHTDRVAGALVSSVTRIVSWSPDKTLRLWDTETGECAAVLDGHKYAVKGALLLSNGGVLSWSTERTLRLWNGGTGALVSLLEGHDDVVRGATVLANGNVLSWSDDETLRLWDGTTGDALAVFADHTLAVNGACELTDGRLMSWADDGSLRLWNGEARVQRRVVVDAHADLVAGTRVLSGGTVLSWTIDGTLRLWSGTTGQSLATLTGHTDAVSGAVQYGEGQVLSWAQDGIRIWDRAGVCVAVLAGHESTDGVSVLRDGRILSWSRDHTLKIWNLGEASQSPIELEGHSGVVVGATELESGHLLSWSEDHTLRLWDRTGASLAVFTGLTDPVLGATEVADGHILSWSKDARLQLWDGESGARLAVLEGHTDSPRGAAGLVDGGLLTWSHDHTVRLWDRAGVLLLTCTHPGWIRGAKALADGRFLSWSAEEVRLWNGLTEAPVGLFNRHEPDDMQALVAVVGENEARTRRQLVEALALEAVTTDDVGDGGLASSERGRFVRIHHMMLGSRRIDWPDVSAVHAS